MLRLIIVGTRYAHAGRNTSGIIAALTSKSDKLLFLTLLQQCLKR